MASMLSSFVEKLERVSSVSTRDHMDAPRFLDQPLDRVYERGLFFSSQRLFENPLKDINQVTHGRREVLPGLGSGGNYVEALPSCHLAHLLGCVGAQRHPIDPG